MPITVDIQGLNKVLNNLATKDKEIANIIDDVIENNVLLMAGMARRLAPSGNYKGGNKLIESIEGRPVKFMVHEVVAKAYYAPYVEFGTGAYVDIPPGLEEYAMTFYKNGKGTMKAHPFLFPAVNAYRKQLVKDIVAELKALKKL